MNVLCRIGRHKWVTAQELVDLSDRSRPFWIEHGVIMWTKECESCGRKTEKR